jgi:tetratricopeptide (TPR) repeat protein
MQSLFFWKDWPAHYRWIGNGLAAAFIFSLLFFWFSYWKGADGVIQWDQIQEQKIVETTVHNFRLGPFELNIPADSYVIFEYFNGSYSTPNTTASYIFLAVMIISVVVLTAVVTTLEGFWFYTGMALIIFFLVSLRLEVVGLFGLYNRTPLIGVLLLFAGGCFYFNRFGRSVPFASRLLYFSVVTLVVGVCIGFFSSVELPLYHLTLTGYTPGLVLAVLFIILVAHEVFASFIYMVSQGATKSLRHLSIISFIYFLYLLITCLHELDVIDWNFIYINPYVLLTISALLGLWGFRAREPLYGNIFPFRPFGAYFFLALGAICFATIGQLLGNANDPAVKIIRDAIIFSHTGYGLIFMTYIISNFILMLARNLPVYKVLYQPNRMPYFTYRLAGTIAMLGFVFYAGWRDYVYHGMAGFYNGTGDLYTLLGNETYAQSFYEQGSKQSFQNHHAHYALATIKASRLNYEEAHDHYWYANSKRPTAYSLLNDGNLRIWENDLFGAIEAYHHADRTIPGSGPIQNNLGFAYAKVHNLDSALSFLSAAREHRISKASAETNFFAMATAETLPFKADSILTIFNTNAPGVAANALALSTLFGKPFDAEVDPLSAKQLTLHSATLLNNYIIHHARSLDTTFTNRAFRIVSDSVNLDFSEALKASLAYAYYHQGNVTRALQILAELVYISQTYQGKFNYIMGLWALEQGNPELASSYFTFADTYDYKEARFYNAIALTEGRNVGEALAAWDSVQLRGEEGEQQIAAGIKRILLLSSAEAMTLSDADKYQFCRYRVGLRDSLFFDRLVNTFDNHNYKAQALLDISRHYYDAGYMRPAIRFYNRVAGLDLTDSTLYNDVRHFELLMLASRKELRTLAAQINKGITFGPSRSLEKMLYTGLLAAASGDTTRAAKHFEILGAWNPYFDEGILAAADFFRNHDKKGMKPYTLLAEAIHINTNSIRLLRAYIDEALRQGFDEYAASAGERLRYLEGYSLR